MADLTPDAMPRRTVVIFFLIDTSGSMYGNKIGAVKSSMEEILPMIRKMNQNNTDAEVKIAALTFADYANWIYDEPKLAENFFWRDVDADGSTNFGEACEKLNEKLSRHEFLPTSTGSGYFVPVILLLSDGEPTDNVWEYKLADLKQNKWFKHSLKFAIAIGDDCDEDVLAEFTGNKESIKQVHNVKALETLIRLVSITSSQIGSQSKTIGTTTKQDQLNQKIDEQTDGVDGVGGNYDDDWD